MTVSAIERITGLTVCVFQPPKGERGMTTALGYEDGLVVARGTAMKPKDALDALLRDNWARVCGIVARRQRYLCAECARVRPLQFHHVIPRSKGRLDTPGNVVGICTGFGCGAHRRIHGG